MEPDSDNPATESHVEHAGVLIPDWDERLYQETYQLLDTSEAPVSAGRRWLWLLISLAAFALSGLLIFDSQQVALVIGVLLLHESGHFLGALYYGHSNVRMVFIPFFGGAVLMRQRAAPAWQDVVILLLGPLPGLLLGYYLMLALTPERQTLWYDLCAFLVIVNALNLIPLVPLDGGRILELLLFGRQPALAVSFQGFAVVGLAALAWWAETWALVLVAVIVGLRLPHSYRNARLKRAFCGNSLRLPEHLEQVDEPHRRELFSLARLLHPWEKSPQGLARQVRHLHIVMASPQADAVATVVLLLLYGLGIACAADSISLLRA